MRVWNDMSKLDITITESEEAIVIKLSGAADMEEAALLNRHLDQVFSQERYRLVMDLSGLDFTSSMGLSILIKAHTRCRDNKGGLSIVNPKPGVLKIFQTTRLDQLFNIYSSLEEALQ
jgi:anti-sigma B factor antagonist